MRGRHQASQRAAALVGVALALGLTAPAAAGPWTRGPGQVYAKLAEGLFFSDSYRDSNGVLQSGGISYFAATTSLYFEVGIWKGLHAWGYLPHVFGLTDFKRAGRRTLQASGGDAMLGLQWAPFPKLSVPLAFRLEVKVPLYDLADVPPLFAAPGDGQLDLTFWVSAGDSVLGSPLYVFGELGYRKRTEYFPGNAKPGEYADGIAYFASVGYTALGRVTVAINSGGSLPFDAGTVSKGFVTLGPAFYVAISHGLAFEAWVDWMAWTNHNAAPGLGFGIGLSYKR